MLTALQLDPAWCGGITELVKGCALSAIYGVPVIPHGHLLHPALHVVASQSPGVCPKVEFLTQHLTRQQYFHKAPLIPEGGTLPLPQGPGLGYEIDEAKVEEREEVVGER